MARTSVKYKHSNPIDLRSTRAREKEMKGVVLALQAFAEGKADGTQQLLIRDFLLTDLCNTYQPSFFPESVRETDFGEGRRYVGLQLTKLIKTPFNKLFPEAAQ